MPSDIQEIYSIKIERNGLLLARKAFFARSHVSRMVGLLGKKNLSRDEALIIPGCCSIHTFGMKFAIDVVFADKAFRVRSLCKDIKPGRITPVFWGCWYAVELSSGTIQRSGLKLEDRLVLEVQKSS